MKKALFLLTFFSMLTLSCDKGENGNQQRATGKINTISVIIDDQLWNGSVGDSIRNKFASPIVGLPREEPLFTINQYPIRLLEGFMANSRNVIVIKKEQSNKFQIIKNEFASPQNVFHISGKTAVAILKLIEDNSDTIMQMMKQTEITEIHRIIDTALIDSRRITKKFKIALHIPNGYKYVREQDKFVWLKKEITSGNTSILIYELPMGSLKNNQNVIDDIITIRDSIGKLYLHGATPDTEMVTEDSYAPYLFNTKIKGRKTFETRGTWEMKNDFMSGPFINYCILDQNRILVIEGFCYAPSKKKRDLMFELESIITPVEFVNDKMKK